MQVTALQNLVADRLSDFIADLTTLTAIDCGTHNRAGVNQVASWVDARCRANGWEVRNHPGTTSGDKVEAIITGSGSRHILVLAHMDTVYPDGTAATRPLRQDGDRLIGPGSCDMKAGLLAGIYAVEALQALSHTPWKQITLLFTSDEEIGSPESRELIEACAATCDAALVVEPARASGAIVGERKGVRDFFITVHGRSAHAGVEPQKGRNAILEMAHKIVALQALNGTVPGATINVGVVHGGTAANVVADTATAAVDVRGTEPEGLDTIEARIREIVATMTIADVTADVHQRHGFPPMPRTEAIDRMVAHAQAVAHDLGFELEAVSTGGASDASLVAGAGKPVVDGLGPIGGDAHSPTEWVSASSIAPRVALLGGLIARIAVQGVH